MTFSFTRGPVRFIKTGYRFIEENNLRTEPPRWAHVAILGISVRALTNVSEQRGCEHPIENEQHRFCPVCAAPIHVEKGTPAVEWIEHVQKYGMVGDYEAFVFPDRSRIVIGRELSRQPIRSMFGLEIAALRNFVQDHEQLREVAAKEGFPVSDAEFGLWVFRAVGQE